MITAAMIWWYGLWFIPTTILFWAMMLRDVYQKRAAFILNKNGNRAETLAMFVLFSVPVLRELFGAFLIFVEIYELTREIIQKVSRTLDK